MSRGSVLLKGATSALALIVANPVLAQDSPRHRAAKRCAGR